MTSVAFIGLGNMGLPMALNLIKAKYQVQAFDLAEAPLRTITEQGGKAFNSASEACIGADIVVSMLPAGKHVKAVYLGNDDTGLLAAIDASTLVIDCSTIDTDSACAVHQACAEKGIAMLDAPVSGGVAAAAAGTLSFMCGGTEENFERAKPVLSAMGANIFLAGGDGAGQVAKMCNNMLLAIHMIGTSEALKLGEKNGLDAARLSEIMLASSGKNWSLEKYNPFPGVMDGAPASNNYQPGFMVDLMAKDLGLAIGNAQETESNTPLGKMALDLYTQKQQAGDGQKDFSSIIELLT
jgi:3-hydroxyisobutyrate dehydrogenase